MCHKLCACFVSGASDNENAALLVLRSVLQVKEQPIQNSSRRSWCRFKYIGLATFWVAV